MAKPRKNKAKLPLVVLGADHAGFALKEELARYLVKQGIAWLDVGAHQLDKKDDYPDYAAKAAGYVANSRGKAVAVLICSSGIGMCMAANKIKGIRAANVMNVEGALLAKRKDNANVLCLGASFVTSAAARRIVSTWLSAEFEAGRHLRRLNKISKLD